MCVSGYMLLKIRVGTNVGRQKLFFSFFFLFYLTKFIFLPVSYIDLKPECMCQNQTFVQVKSQKYSKSLLNV